MLLNCGLEPDNCKNYDEMSKAAPKKKKPI